MIPMLLIAIFISQTSLIQAAFNPTVFVFSNLGLAKKKKKKSQNFLDSKLIKKIYKRQARRQKSLNKYKAKGRIGEADSGFILIYNVKKLSKKERAGIEKLVKVENGDRERLYSEVARVNKYNEEQMKFFKFTMFETYFEYDAKGVYYFRADHWQKK